MAIGTTYKLKEINKNCQGFTLVELLAAIVITALIGSATATAVFQVFRINSSSTNHQIAISQVETTVNSVSRDAQQAQVVVPKDAAGVALPMNPVPTISFNLGTGHKLTVKWTDWDNSQKEVTYSMVSNTLQRDFRVYVNGIQTEQKTTTIASNISVASGNWNTNTKVLTFRIAAQVGTSNPATETRTIQITPRPAQ